MPTIKGNLMFVSSRAAQVSEVWVRAREVRTHLEGVVTTGNDRFPVDGGEVSFTAVPGPAVLALISQGRAVDTIPILVGDASTQTLRQVVSAAKIADDATQREIEKLAAQAVELVDSSTANAKKAQEEADRAEGAASEAGRYKTYMELNWPKIESSTRDAVTAKIEAAQSAYNAAASERAAKGSATLAETAADNAKKSESSASSSASGAKSSASSASSSASKASTSEQNAAKSASAAADSASQAADSATNAKRDADRAARIADSTSWNGDKLTVNGKTSPSLTGPKGDPGQDGKDGASTWADISGKPSTFPPSGHRHSSADISDAVNDAGDPKFGGKVIKGRERDGKIFYYSAPTEGKELSNKSYVDTAVAAKPDKSYVDTAVAAEKARTVGMVWMAESEDDVNSKAASCQTDDFIQVASTGNIYRVGRGRPWIIKSGVKAYRATVSEGAGWVDVTRAAFGGPNPNWFSGGPVLVTATAWDCDGVAITLSESDWEITSTTTGKAHTLSATVDATSSSVRVRLNNPASNAEVLISLQPHEIAQ